MIFYVTVERIQRAEFEVEADDIIMAESEALHQVLEEHFDTDHDTYEVTSIEAETE